MEVRAHYEITAYQLVAECHGPGDITVDGVWSGSRYEKWLPIGTTVQVRADAAPGFAFLRWNGSVVSTDNPVEVTLDESVRIYAEFLKLETVKVYPDRDATLYADAAGSIANGSVRRADEQPVEVSVTGKWERVISVSGEGEPITPYELLKQTGNASACLLYTSDAADDLLCVDLGGRRIINKNTQLN